MKSSDNKKKRIVDKIKGKKEENFVMFSKNYKKVPCEFYRKGNCHKGADCTYRHDIELKQLDVLCKHHLVGACHNPNCLYLHDTNKYPCKFLYISGKCDKGLDCTFSHERMKSQDQMKDFINNNLEQIRIHRDKGILTPIIKYAMERGYIKEDTAAAHQLIPPDIYESDSESSSRSPKKQSLAEDKRPEDLFIP